MEMRNQCTCGHALNEAAPWSNAHCFVVVTGASRGFGRAFCVQLMKDVSANHNQNCPPARSLTFFLFGRDLVALRETENMIISSINESGSTSVTVYFAGGNKLDMINVDAVTLSESLQPIHNAYTKSSKTGEPQWNILVNNAGSLGNLQLRCDQHLSLSHLEQYYHANLFSQILLTSIFLEIFAPSSQTHMPTTVMSVSSLAAIKPFSNMMNYCTGKAARDMHLRCLSLDRPDIAAFIYSPGPMNTAMYEEIEHKQPDVSIRNLFKDRREQGLVIQPNDSARSCVYWLKRQRFSSNGNIIIPSGVCLIHQDKYVNLWKGQHFDFFEARDLEEAELLRVVT